ncbi:MAG: hypothetical protein V4639_01850 [Pseudomonadota bacterium]
MTGKRIFSVAMLICIATQSSNAFERDGFIWGMSIDEATNVLVKAGWVVEKMPVKNPHDFVFFHKRDTPHDKGSLSFCNARLASYAPPYVLPIPHTRPISYYIGSLAELTEQYGPAKYRAAGSKGGSGWVQHYWRREEEIINLQLAAVGSEAIAIAYIQPKSCLDKFP